MRCRAVTPAARSPTRSVSPSNASKGFGKRGSLKFLPGRTSALRRRSTASREHRPGVFWDASMNRLLVICDSSDAAADIGSRLAGRFDMQFTGSGDVHEIAACDNLVVDIDLFDGRKVSAFAEWLRRRPAGGKVIFVVERGVRHQAVQAMAVGATDLISRPVDGDVLLEMIVGIAECRADGSSADTIARSDSVHAGIYALDDAFQAACAGAPVDLQSIDAAGRIITSGMKVDGLAQWIDAVRSYHSQTYQHCLLVTGIAVTFGQRLGFRDGDQHKLAFAGLLHDIGKARIPLAILEKPEPLTPDEVS